MVNYRSQLLQSGDKEGGGMKRQQYNQTWEELPQCVQRYLQRVAPEPLRRISSPSPTSKGALGWPVEQLYDIRVNYSRWLGVIRNCEYQQRL